LHSQNVTLSELLNQESDPALLSHTPNNMFLASLHMGREYLSSSTLELQNSRMSRAREDKLLESAIAIADSRHCPMPRPTGHLFRVVSLLWRTLICGDGEPDLVWANPSASLPLRVHSFATLLHLVGATSLYLAKNGVSQVDGTGKFSFVVLGRVLALLFDEHKLFGHQAIEKFDLEHWCSLEVNKQFTSAALTKKSPPKVRHVRQTYELGHELESRSLQNSAGASNISSTAGDLATLPKSESTEATTLSGPLGIEFGKGQHTVERASAKAELKVDSKFDFQSLMRLSAASDEDDEINLKSGNEFSAKDFGMERPTKALIQAYGGISGVGGRRYMTMPAPLSTILEGADDMPIFSERQESTSSELKDKANSNDTNVVAGTTSAAKQMRRPRVFKGFMLDAESSKSTPPQGLSDKASRISDGTLATDDDLTSMGDAYLDKLSGLDGLSSCTRYGVFEIWSYSCLLFVTHANFSHFLA
jgi:hypothetical protein